MKIRHKFAATVIAGCLAGISLGFWGALLLHNEIHHLGYEKIVSKGVLAGVFVFVVILIVFAFAFRRSFFKAISDISSFTDQLGSGGVPDPMNLPSDGDISRLYSLLNYLRDRQQSLSAKLAAGIERESSLRREIEFYDALLIGALKKLLDEIGQNISVIKGLALCNLDHENLSAEERTDFTTRALRRVGILNREIELGADLLRLDRERVMNRSNLEFSTSGLYQEITERTTLGFASRKITLSGNYNASVPGCLRGDRELLGEILFLMLRTVGRVTKTGGTVLFNVSGGGKRVIFEVAVERTSPTFEELAEKYLEFNSGSGGIALEENTPLNVLGLEIIKQIAEYTGSPFTVSSDEVCSTRLVLTLDRGFENDGVRMTSRPYRSQETPAPQNQERHALRILLADSDDDECTALKKLMKDENIELSTASDEKQLLSTLEELPFDGVLLAPPFSNTNAPELIRTLRKRSGWSRLPVVVISPQVSEETLAEFNDMNRVKFLSMPINYEQLARLLHSCL